MQKAKVEGVPCKGDEHDWAVGMGHRGLLGELQVHNGVRHKPCHRGAHKKDRAKANGGTRRYDAVHLEDVPAARL